MINLGRAVGLFNKFTPKITKGIGQVANIARNVGQAVKNVRNIGSTVCDTRYVDQGPKEWVLVGHGRAGSEEADVGPGAQNGTAHGPTWARAPDRAGA